MPCYNEHPYIGKVNTSKGCCITSVGKLWTLQLSAAVTQDMSANFYRTMCGIISKRPWHSKDDAPASGGGGGGGGGGGELYCVRRRPATRVHISIHARCSEMMRMEVAPSIHRLKCMACMHACIKIARLHD